ncbi:GIN domain-containing protein [Mariniflexile sp. AS56]|uniref:GIN domain-containing protein n=1 Tax=Mariniflexile sp. AS56 TaxID=3063957 RepID=UPI0026EE11CE|nr:DUF2807 domain-containing protein [Mariniflexile sp. AS56]MDO7171724.1 DUF2807 domain-containing protein [Mariniflexile sp. AS56]
MNKFLTSNLIILLFCFVSVAQTPEKVKGNKNVTIVQTELKPFHSLEIDEDFNVEIIYNTTPSVTIETDENLHEFINFAVVNGVLSFDTATRITSKKRLNITVNYNDSLNHIKVTDSGEILSLTTMNLASAVLIAEGSAKVGLTIKTSNFELQGIGKAKLKLNLTCDKAKISLTDTNRLEALINAPITQIDLYQRASAIVEGSAETFRIRTDNYSDFNGRNFATKTCTTLNEVASEVYLDVTDSLTVDASGSSSIYLYGEPEIVVTKLSGTSKIQKKEK